MDSKMARALELKAARETLAKVDALAELLAGLLVRLERIESSLAEIASARANPPRKDR